MRSGAFWRLFSLPAIPRPASAAGKPMEILLFFPGNMPRSFRPSPGIRAEKKVLNQLRDDCFFYELPERSRRDIDTPEDL